MKDKIKFIIEYEFPIAKVWKAITDKKAVSQWLMPCNIAPIVGHKFQFKTESNLFFNGIIDCEVLAVIENELFSFSWNGGPIQNTTVIFRLKEVDGKTILHFEHNGFDGLFNKIVVRKILSNGWKSKILSKYLLKYLVKNG